MIHFANIDPALIDATLVQVWETTPDSATKHMRASATLRVAKKLVESLEEQLAEARRDLTLAEALKTMTDAPPTWRNTLGNLRITSHEGQQKACAEYGYDYYVFNEQVFTKSGVSCGMSEQDLK